MEGGREEGERREKGRERAVGGREGGRDRVNERDREIGSGRGRGRGKGRGRGREKERAVVQIEICDVIPTCCILRYPISYLAGAY